MKGQLLRALLGAKKAGSEMGAGLGLTGQALKAGNFRGAGEALREGMGAAAPGMRAVGRGFSGAGTEGMAMAGAEAEKIKALLASLTPEQRAALLAGGGGLAAGGLGGYMLGNEE